MTRRRFLLASAMLGALAATGGALWMRGRPASRLIAAAIRKHLGHLRITAEDVDSFAAEHAKRISPKERRVLGLLAPLAGIYASSERLSSLLDGPRLRRFEELAVTNFLLGSDFFPSGADESRAVRYVAYPDPYSRPCANPLARR